MPNLAVDDSTPTQASKNAGRSALLREISAAMARHLPTASPPQLDLFLNHYAASLTTEALSERSADDLAGAVLSLWSFAQEREPGRAKIRVFNPRGNGNGWGSAAAIVEIVNDDMRFLVESALGVLQRLEQPVHALVHPVLPVSRDAAGRLTEIGTGAPESIMQIAFGPQADAVMLAHIADVLDQAMNDARHAVTDAEAMRYALARTVQSLEPGVERDFLDWLGQDNFVLLGVTEINLSPALDITADATSETLGVLRASDIPLFDSLNTPSAWRAVATEALTRFDALAIAKADIISRVHRPQLYDVVVVKRRDPAGSVIGLTLFAGLFAADAYNRNPRSIPLLAEKVETILAASGVAPGGHDGRALRHILDTWPRDDLFQGTTEEILAAATRVMALQVRPELALFLRRDLLGRHISAITFIPRDRFDTALRLHLAAMLIRAVNGDLAGYAIAMGDGPLARVHYTIAADPAQARALDQAALEAAMKQAARSFRERLAEALTIDHGEARVAAILADWGDAFPEDYAAHTPAAVAARDITTASSAQTSNALCLTLGRPFGMEAQRLVLKLFRAGTPIALSDIVPLIESLGLRVIEEVPYRLNPRGGAIALQALTLETADHAPLDLDARGPAIRAAIEAAWEQRCEIDGFNRLILRAGLDWREAWLLRAMFKWCRQVRAPFSQGAVEAALATHPDATRILIALFHARFDPNLPRDESSLDVHWNAALDAVDNPDDDRILRRLRTLLDAMLRTNFYDRTSPVVAFKIASAQAGDMPLPRPMIEIFVHGARMEGCHLRGGKVARGGIRWSDRRDDFRTEILGLMKAQMVKNVVIVPVGAKGGFVLKRPPAPTGDANADRESFSAEGIACYKLLINAMLDLTDNLQAGQLVAAPVVRRDGDDPYLVVAADKGTASFSDIANAIALDRGFWLGDAFASGGSVGYDHKVMGITARGAWVNIARHFHELDHDIQSENFTCAGVGDMSGDVFGNGLLISQHTKLVAAFDHRHIFLDPDPDPAASFAERQRLFALPRSSWADYATTLLSPGGAILPRHAKTVTLSPQAAAMLDLAPGAHDPADVIRTILTMQVDLLYFGGIGTYIKAGTESDADVGDRANDSIRIDGRSVRARVIGEGANLAVTQAGRIEAALKGAKINTDALDNSAGVSTSDHEVNIKILLADAMAHDRLTAGQRVELLQTMTDQVAALVLRDNAQQSQAISLDALGGATDLSAQNALMSVLEAAGILNRAVAGLPDPQAMAARAAAGIGLTRPELCTLMAHTKLHLAAVLEESPLLDDPALAPALVEYFPTALQSRFGAELSRHRLRRELIGTAVTNELVNRLGAAAFGRLVGESGFSWVDAARAALIARAAFDLPRLCDQVERLEKIAAAAQLSVLAAARVLQESVTRRLLGDKLSGSIEAALTALRPGLSTLVEQAIVQAITNGSAQSLIAQSVPAPLAGFAMAVPALQVAPLIVTIATRTQADVGATLSAWDQVGAACGIDMLRNALASVPPQGAWGARALAALTDDLSSLQAALVTACVTTDQSAEALLAEAGASAASALALAHDAAVVPDLASLSVAVRELQRSLRPKPTSPVVATPMLH
ncbi:MAG TPA: NAD-glutamate dehydrogenase [Acidiphilium sp.]|nr:MAG: NAD-glutamate dehydrogenase [Acidiphilium sp. 21-60-14]OYV90296.1 MAG: NAD-glutamate dehydrogenase [Acidiphilium sp. 37-60-79]HQT89075.1 NAD-glutamate dehydrogenase [Acidiphilium sp.]HQU24357.1 NAD-glutamate dehydrogenase [Acidiphilium sp.]